jgi:hypothetical protein
MIIYFNLETGEALGTLEGWNHEKGKLPMGMTFGHISDEKVGVHIICKGDPDEELARQLELPTAPVVLKDVLVQDGFLVKKA